VGIAKVTSTPAYISDFPLLKISDLLTPWSRVLLEKLTVFRVVKKFPAFYETRRLTTAVTSVCHLSLS
jgi:hypothetical protein